MHSLDKCPCSLHSQHRTPALPDLLSLPFPSFPPLPFFALTLPHLALPTILGQMSCLTHRHTSLALIVQRTHIHRCSSTSVLSACCTTAALALEMLTISCLGGNHVRNFSTYARRKLQICHSVHDRSDAHVTGQSLPRAPFGLRRVARASPESPIRSKLNNSTAVLDRRNTGILAVHHHLSRSDTPLLTQHRLPSPTLARGYCARVNGAHHCSPGFSVYQQFFLH